jgi:hypothetical protein
LRKVLETAPDEALLQECESGELASLTAYLAALEADLPAGVCELIERQLEAVKEGYDRLCSMD